MKIFMIALALVAFPLMAQDIENTRGVDSRVDYKQLVNFGPWDDRNYQLTLEDLELLAPNEAKLRVQIPAFFRVELRRNLPNLRRSGQGQYPRNAPEWFKKMYGGIMTNGKVQKSGEEQERFELRTLSMPPVNQEVRVNAQVGRSNPTISHNPVSPNLVIAGANAPSHQEMYYSSDGGLTWSVAPPLSGDTCCDPTVDWSSDGTIAYTATRGFFFLNLPIWFYRSTDNGHTWGNRIDLTTATSGYEFIHVDHSPSSPFQDNVYLTWTDELLVMQFARSTDLGLSFDPIQSFSSDPIGIGSDITTTSNGDIYYVWPGTDTRQIWFKKSTDGGATFAPAQSIAATMAGGSYPIPAMDTLDVLIYVAADTDRSGGPFDGSVYACWNDTYTTDDDSDPNANHARVVFAYSRDGGQNWTTSIPHPTADADHVDRFNQWMQVDLSGIIHLVYYDTTRDLPNRIKTDLYYNVSIDGGQTWRTPERITADQSAKIINASEYGNHNGMSVTSTQVLPIWADNRLVDVSKRRADSVDVYTADVANIYFDPDFIMEIPQFEFIMENSQPEVLLCQDDQIMIDVNIVQLHNFSNAVTLAATGLPSGLTAQFSVNPVTPPGMSVLTLTADPALSAGTYPISIDGTATSSPGHASALDVIVQDGPPGAPTLTAPTDGNPFPGVLEVHFRWEALSDVTSYQIQCSDQMDFSNLLFDETVTDPAYLGTGFTDGQTYFWRVSATNGCHEGPWSTPFSFEASPAFVLLVDQDDNSPDIRAFYTSTFDALNITYTIHDYAGSGAPTSGDLQMHPVTVWYSGDRLQGPDAADLANLETYIDAGGYVFLSSQDFLWPFRPNVPALGATLFGIGTVENETGDYTSVSGASGSIFDGMSSMVLDYSGRSMYDFSDNIGVGGMGILAMTGDNGNGAAIQTDETVFFAFPFSALHTGAGTTSAPLQDVMTAILDHFGSCANPISVSDTGPYEVCAGSSVGLQVNASGGTGPYSYNWTPSGGLSSTTTENPDASPSQTTTYTVEVSDPQCSTTRNVTVFVHPDLASGDYSGWLGDDSTFTPKSNGRLDTLDYVSFVNSCTVVKRKEGALAVNH